MADRPEAYYNPGGCEVAHRPEAYYNPGECEVADRPEAYYNSGECEVADRPEAYSNRQVSVRWLTGQRPITTQPHNSSKYVAGTAQHELVENKMSASLHHTHLHANLHGTEVREWHLSCLQLPEEDGKTPHVCSLPVDVIRTSLQCCNYDNVTVICRAM